MLGFSHPWRRNGRVEFVTPPVEVPTERTVARIDLRLKVVSNIPPAVRTRETWEIADRLLDQRNAIRAPRPTSAPVIPGRS